MDVIYVTDIKFLWKCAPSWIFLRFATTFTLKYVVLTFPRHQKKIVLYHLRKFGSGLPRNGALNASCGQATHAKSVSSFTKISSFGCSSERRFASVKPFQHSLFQGENASKLSMQVESCSLLLPSRQPPLHLSFRTCTITTLYPPARAHLAHSTNSPPRSLQQINWSFPRRPLRKCDSCF